MDVMTSLIHFLDQVGRRQTALTSEGLHYAESYCKKCCVAQPSLMRNAMCKSKCLTLSREISRAASVNGRAVTALLFCSHFRFQPLHCAAPADTLQKIALHSALFPSCLISTLEGSWSARIASSSCKPLYRTQDPACCLSDIWQSEYHQLRHPLPI